MTCASTVQSTVAANNPAPIQYSDPGRTEAFVVANQQSAGSSGYIEICSGPATGAVFPIRKQVISIGRDLSNDLVIDSAEVSRFHAEIHSTQWTVTVVDRQSLNGTFINGLQLMGSQLIESGDQIMLGTTICRFWYEL